jgi:hypothetical protein
MRVNDSTIVVSLLAVVNSIRQAIPQSGPVMTVVVEVICRDDLM